MMHNIQITPIPLPAEFDPKNHAQVADLINPLIDLLQERLGYTDQSIVDGLLILAAKETSRHVMEKLPHKPIADLVHEASENFKTISNVLADYAIEQYGHWKGN